MANNRAFGERRFGLTPFEYITADEATSDLPDLGDGRTYQCIRHPDHRMTIGVSPVIKAQIEAIPLHPRGMNFTKAWKQGKGVMSEAERALFPLLSANGKVRQNIMPDSKAWGRIHPRGLFGTIATSVSPTCSRVGKCLHWNQQRIITVMEARRAQSFPDHEVLIGSPLEQWKIVGNSVARTVSLALGLCLREAWLRNAPDNEAERTAHKITNAISTTRQRHSSQQSMHSIQSHRVVPDSVGASSDEAALSDRRFRRFLDSHTLRSSESRDEIASSMSSAGSDSKPDKSGLFKRQQSMLDDTKTVPPRKKAKSSKLPPRSVAVVLQSNNVRPTLSSGEETHTRLQPSINRRLDRSTLTRKLEVLRDEHILIEDSEDEEDISPTSFASATLVERFKMQTIKTRSTGRAKAPLKPTKAKLVINLISDDEDAGGETDE
jgi:DNA (cytosine-5)-methyltransferase 1